MGHRIYINAIRDELTTVFPRQKVYVRNGRFQKLIEFNTV